MHGTPRGFDCKNQGQGNLSNGAVHRRNHRREIKGVGSLKLAFGAEGVSRDGHADATLTASPDALPCDRATNPPQTEFHAPPTAAAPPTPPPFPPTVRAATSRGQRRRPFMENAGRVALHAMPETRPAPLCGALHQIRSQGVPLHVPQDRQQMLVLFDRKRLETPLIERTGPRRAMRRVPPLRVRHREPTHELRKLAIASRPKHQVPMVRHHAPGQNPHRQSLLCLD